MSVVNQSQVDFQYRIYPGGPIISQTIFSNTVSTVIVNDILTAEKQVDKLTATVFDVLTYTIRIFNISDKDITNVYFQDTLSKVLKFIANSIKINEVKKRCLNPKDGFKIGTISPGSCLIISFKAVVLPQYSDCIVNNCSNITFDYIYNVELPPIRATIQTNEVYTKIENKLFKQFSIGNIVGIPANFPSIHSINNIDIKLKILNTKTVASPIIGEANLCKLIVIGTIEYNILYNYKSERRKSISLQKLTDIEGFSSYILVPYGIEYCQINNNVTLLVESVSNTVLNEKSLFIDASVLMYC